MKRVVTIVVLLAMLLTCFPAVTLATNATNTLNGEDIPFSQWTNAAFGGWEQLEDGTLVPTELTDFTMLRLEQDLGEEYTIEFDVKQEDNTSGWNTIQIGFEVNEGENFTQSGFLLDMHNFGVARVIEFSKANSGAEVLGSYDNPYGGTIEFSKTTEWIHIKVQRDGAGFTITINDGTEKVITFLTENFSGGHFVLGAVGNRMVMYKNINITTGDAPVVDPGTDPEPTPAVGTDTYNGEPFAFSEWTSAGFGGWQQLEDGTIVPTELTDFTLLRLEKNLGNVYTVELDVKQEDNTTGWNTIQIGFDVKEGENFTQSGLTLDMHNAGVARVINYGSANMGASKPGSYDNPYGGNVEFSATTEWIHVKIQRNGSDFTITFNDGTEKTITFTTDEYNGGYLVLGAVGTRMVSYKNIVIDCAEVYVEIEEDPRAIEEETEPGVNTYHGEPITIDDWSALGDSEWVEENGIYYTKDMVEYSMLTLNKPLGETYTIELDVRQNQVSTGWNTIMIGFDVNEGENLSTSGLTLDMHNAGVWRIIDFKDRDNKNVAIGNYSNPYGGERWDYSCTTQWIHIRIERLKNYYSVTINDGTEKTIRFETDAYNGGHLCISAVGKRDIMFKNITILDHVTSLAASEPTYPETIGSTTYTFDGNAYGEWIAPEGWKAEGSSFTSTITEGEQTAYLNVATMRNFKLTLDYEVLSENGGTFGIGFRKKTGAGTYQGLGYALIFKLDPEGNTMTIADYTASGAAGLDGMAHEFELAGNVTLTASGNEFCVWLDDELILNATSNAYAFGHISLFTEGCSVEFANIEVTSDALLPDIVWDVLEAINANQEITPEMAARFDQISEFEKSMVPANVLAKVEAAQQQTSSDSGAWIYVAIGCGVAVVAAVVILLVLKKKKAKK